MVSESVMSGACTDFIQNAWRKDLCSNCQRSRAEHATINGTGGGRNSSPVPVKRKSLLINTGTHDGQDVVNIAKRNAAFLLSASEKSESSGTEDQKERTNQFVEFSDANLVKTDAVVKSVLVTNGVRRTESKLNVEFNNRDPDIIGDDGGYDNLFLDDINDECDESDDSNEDLSFTEEEKEFVLLALENTLWNSEIKNLNGETRKNKDNSKSKEFEDVKLLSLWKIDRFATLRDVDKIIPKRYGTFPLRKPVGEKSHLEKMFSEKADNLQRSSSEVQVTENENQYETNFFTFEKRRSRSASEMEEKSHGSGTNATPYKIISVTDIIEPSNKDGPELPAKSKSQNSEATDHLDVFNSLDESVFDLDFDSDILDNFNSNIDLDSSTAGMDLVDLLNDVLAKYSDGISIKGFEDHDLLPDSDDKAEGAKAVTDAATLVESLRIPKGSIKSKEFEAKLVSLAANLDLSRKKGKRPAPRPPTSPPPEPGVLSKKSSVSTVTTELDSTKSSPSTSPANTLQNPPSFKMVPIGKSIIGSQQEKPLSPKRTGDFHEDPTEVSKPKSENKSNKKGFTSFFKNILRRGKDSPENSVEQMSEKTNSADNLQSENGTKDSKKDNGQSSPQPKTKVLSATKAPRTSIVMTTSSNQTDAQKTTSPQNKKKAASNSTEKADISISLKDKGENTEEKVPIESVPSAKPVVPLRPKPPPNPNKPCISPQLSQKDLAKTSGVKDISRSSPGKEASRSSPGKDAPRSSPAKEHPRSSPGKDTSPAKISSKTLPLKEIFTSTPTQERRTSADQEKRSSLEKESQKPVEKEGIVKPERPSRARKSSTEKEESGGKENESSEKEAPVVRRRAKSPKRFTAPPKPAKPVENRNSLFAKELEMRLSKNLDQSKLVMTAAPPSPPVKRDQGKTKEDETETQCSPVTRAKKGDAKKVSVDIENAQQNTTGKENSQAAPEVSSPTSPKAENDGSDQKSAKDQTSPETVSQSVPVEKIELPAKAPSRRSFLGKLSNKKSKAPPRPPSGVKRAKSISENSQSGELQPKKIDASDISGPVLITPMTGGPVQVTRRNTISIGEDHSLVSGSSTSSGSTVDKYDEWPDFSPIGSLENLYEPIVPKEPAPPPPQGAPTDSLPSKGHVYDPPVSSQSNVMSRSLSVPRTPADGYLEPVRSTAAKTEGEPVAVTQTVLKMDSNVIPESEPEISEEKRRIVAAQPIYEEIVNGNGLNTAITAQEDNLNLNIPDSMTTSDLQLPPVSPSPSHGAVSSGSEPSSACSTLSRPKPLPRKRSQRSVSTHSEQPYIAMNRPSITSALNEAQLRDMLNQLTTMNLHTLRDIYTQYESKFNKEALNLNVSGGGPLKWADFDIYGKPIHCSDRCIVYNAKLRMTMVNCQLMLLHTRPELISTQHPSLLRPTVVFSDAIPFNYLTEDFIKTSQLLYNLQNSANQSNFAKCFVAMGQFDIMDNLTNHMSALRHGSASMITIEDQMETVLFFVLQMLSAISHCLDQGFCLGDADFRDIFLLSYGANCHGNVIAFLPHQKSHDQAESVFNYLERYLIECVSCSASEFGKYCAGVTKIQKMVQSHKLEILSLVRSYIEFLLWGPSEESWQGGVERQSSLEPKLSMWLEKERSALVHTYAKSTPTNAHKYSVKDFYRMKFLLKSSAVSLSECVRTHISFG